MGMLTEWRPIKGFVGYEVSNDGQVRSWRKDGRGNAERLSEQPKTLKQSCETRGYLRVGLKHKDRPGPITKLVSTLVAEAFCGPRPSGQHEVSHLDGNRMNNQASNLTWSSHRDNIGLMIRVHKNTSHCKETWWRRKLTNAQVGEIKARITKTNKAQLAKEFGVSIGCINHIWYGTRHRFIPKADSTMT